MSSSSYALRTHGTRAKAESPLAELLRTAGPKAEGLFSLYRLAPQVVEALLRDTVETLVWKWETVRDREAWLLAVLQRKCEILSAVSPPAEP